MLLPLFIKVIARKMLARMLEEIVDPAGTFYRFGLAEFNAEEKRMQPAQEEGINEKDYY